MSGMYNAYNSESAAVETGELTLTIASTFDLASPLLTPQLIEALQYLAVCSPGPVPLDFLQRLAGSKEIEERVEQLFALSWCERREVDINRANRAYELNQVARELVLRRFGKGFKEDFIRLIHDILFTIKKEILKSRPTCGKNPFK